MKHPTMAVIFAVLLVIGCGSGNNDFEAQKQEYQARITQRVEDAKSSLAETKAELAEASEDSKDAIEQHIEALNRELDQLDQASDELARQTEKSWDAFTRKVESLLDDGSA